jgi:hypothetical protein
VANSKSVTVDVCTRTRRLPYSEFTVWGGVRKVAGEAAAARPLTAPDLTPLTAANCDGRRVLVPAHVWPSYSCDEHAGRGWEAVVLRHSQRAATVRFLHAATARGIPYEDAQLQLTVLNPI